jgi:CRISPR/Cas system-associated exonuclease Cas4 (RecB family)
MTIKFWSFSSSKTYDKCPKAIEHRYVLKTPKDARDNSAAEHKELELYLEGGKKPSGSVGGGDPAVYGNPVDPQQFKFEGQVAEIRELCELHPFTQEEMLYLNSNWEPVTEFKDAWLLAAMDVAIRISETEITIVDWKSGKREGNEISHLHQGQLYALCAWKKWPELTKFNVIFVYLDHGTETKATWKRGHLERIFPVWDAKGKAITSAMKFPAKPNKYSCRYCDYAGSCEFAIKEGEV